MHTTTTTKPQVDGKVKVRGEVDCEHPVTTRLPTTFRGGVNCADTVLSSGGADRGLKSGELEDKERGDGRAEAEHVQGAMRKYDSVNAGEEGIEGDGASIDGA
jgi:hypothetical protein